MLYTSVEETICLIFQFFLSMTCLNSLLPLTHSHCRCWGSLSVCGAICLDAYLLCLSCCSSSSLRYLSRWPSLDIPSAAPPPHHPTPHHPPLQLLLLSILHLLLLLFEHAFIPQLREVGDISMSHIVTLLHRSELCRV